MVSSSQPHPLVFEPMLLPKPWGGRRLANLGKSLPGGQIGECWELADLATTSTTGAGGGAACSRIRHGVLAGQTIRQACAAWGRDLMGDVALVQGGFPLLIKFLDAREHLSVQVHPSPAYARANPQAHLKTECWTILDATPGSVIFKGVKPGVTRADFEQALNAGDGSGCVALMESVPAVVGECHNLPSGTLHALGAGVLVAEVQTPSDTTFRVYDWGRLDGGKPRQLHIQESLQCIQWERARDATRIADGTHRATLVSTGFFDVDALRGPNATAATSSSYKALMLRPGATTTFPLRASPAGAERPAVVMQLRETATLRTQVGELVLQAGDTALVPASLVRAGTIELANQAWALVALPR